MALASGGDTRLSLDPTTKLNGYGCRPFPRPEAFTFASSTATSISDRAYAGVAGTRQVLLREAQLIGLDRAVDVQMERQRIELKQISTSTTTIAKSSSPPPAPTRKCMRCSSRARCSARRSSA